MKKKIVTAVLCAAVGLSALTACGSASGKTAGTEATAVATESAAQDSTAAAETGTDTAAAASTDAAVAAGSFAVKADFEPNADYDKYTVFEYTIESAGATFAVNVSSKEDDSAMEIHCNFYGDEQLVTVEKDGDTYKVTSDKTGFMKTDAPLIAQAAIDANNWAPISK